MLALCIFSKGYYNQRHENRLVFPRRNCKKVGNNSFTNRLHMLEESMDFGWLGLDPAGFDSGIKERIPKYS